MPRGRFELVVAGRLVLPDGRLVDGDLGVDEGRIAAIAEPGALTGDERIDAGRHLVMPGVVDAHVHTRSEPAEGLTRATLAAAAGGVTTIVDMPYDDPTPITNVEAFIKKTKDVDREAITDVALWATIAKTGGLDEIEELVAAGAVGFKVSTFETHPVRFPSIPDGELYLAMQRIRAAGSLIAFHAENDDLVRRRSARAHRARHGGACLQARAAGSRRRRRRHRRDLHALPLDGRGRARAPGGKGQDQSAAAPASGGGSALAAARGRRGCIRHDRPRWVDARSQADSFRDRREVRRSGPGAFPAPHVSRGGGETGPFGRAPDAAHVREPGPAPGPLAAEGRTRDWR